MDDLSGGHAGAVEHIAHERDFKLLCDGLLHFEVGPLVQTYSAAGADKGIDAEFTGTFAGIEGRWVFQYKFHTPAESDGRRRARLKSQYVPTKGARGEFDRSGIAGADGYVLLTNVPASVTLCQALEGQWRRRRHRGPFVVWDVLRLDALLKGREHLARSWTGFKEARCRNQVIGPIWTWVEKARRNMLDPISYPMWPLAPVQKAERVPKPDFSWPLGWRHSVGLAVDEAELVHGLRDPQFHYALAVAYPRALESIGHLVRAQERLVAALLREISGAEKRLLEKLPELSTFSTDQDRADLVRALAFAWLEVTWGYPMRGLHQVSEGRFLVNASLAVPCPPGIEEKLNAMLSETTRGEVPLPVIRARRAFDAQIDRAWKRLWYVVEFGIDSEPE